MNEAEVVSYRYDPYGAVTITRGRRRRRRAIRSGNPWMYTGRFHDEETGLYYYRARYYSALREVPAEGSAGVLGRTEPVRVRLLSAHGAARSTRPVRYES